MLDDFKDVELISYQILKNALDNNKLSHAYLVETNGNKQQKEFIQAIIKSIICPFGYTNCNKCRDCNICNQIDNNEFVELEYINPDGLIIKKEQLSKLQIDFSVKPIIGKKKVYVINDADRMNQMASNSILKFLEEPNEGIIAILTVSSIDKLLDTIVSRCQIISLNNNFSILNLNDFLISFMSEEKKIIYSGLSDTEIDATIYEYIKFINNIEFNGTSAICSENNIINRLKTREDVDIFFNIIILYYYEILKYKLEKNINIFPGKYIDDIKKLSLNNSYKKICSKIKTIVYLKSNNKVNANINLLVDRMILDLVR